MLDRWRGEGRVQGGGAMYLEQAIGSSQLPGTVWTDIFDSLTPEERRAALVPSRRGLIIAFRFSCQSFEGGLKRGGGGGEDGTLLVFQRACTISIRRAPPSCFCA